MRIVQQPDRAGHPASNGVAKATRRPDGSVPRCVPAVGPTLAQSPLRRARYVFLALCVGAVWLALVGRAQAAGLAVDASVATHQGSPSSTITSGTIATSAANELLVAFITSDGPAQASGQSLSSVTGGGLSWKLRERSNAQAGTAEIWEAAAPNPFTSVAVTATRSSGAYGGSIKVVAFTGADTGLGGGVAGASASAGRRRSRSRRRGQARGSGVSAMTAIGLSRERSAAARLFPTST
jgi:hypothetical protein